MPGRQEVTGFIRSTFRSVWSLELLCFLMEHDEEEWSPDALVAELRGSDLIVAQGLASLTAAGLIVIGNDGAARYQPASADLDRLAAAARDDYARSPDAIRRLIVSSATSGLTAFAEAFRLRKD